jgi:hypothetical protein
MDGHGFSGLAAAGESQLPPAEAGEGKVQIERTPASLQQQQGQQVKEARRDIPVAV